MKKIPVFVSSIALVLFLHVSPITEASVYTTNSDIQKMKVLSESINLNTSAQSYIVSSANIALTNGGLLEFENITFNDQGLGVLYLAWAYKITNEDKYAQKAIEYLKGHTTWATDPPTLKGGGEDWNEILSVGINYTLFMQAFSLIEDYPQFAVQERERQRVWFKNLAYELKDSSDPGKWITNVKWFRLTAIAAAGALNNDTVLKNYAFNAYKQYLDYNFNGARVIEADGTLGHEMRRFALGGEDTWYYSGFSLSGMVALAEIARQNGVNLWDYTTQDNRNLKLAFDSHVKYFTGTKWPHSDGEVSFPMIHRDFVGSYQAAYFYFKNEQYLQVLQNNSTGYSGTKRPTNPHDLVGPYVYMYNGRFVTDRSVSPSGVPCTQKSNGDGNCDNLINLLDFELWRKETTRQLTSLLSDYNKNSIVDIIDFNIWRGSMFNGQ